MLIEEKLRTRLDSKSVKKYKLMRRFLRDYKVDLNNLQNGMDELNISVLNNDLKMFKLLQEYGAIIDVEDKDLYMHLSIQNKNLEFLEYILNNIELNFDCIFTLFANEYIINQLGGKDLFNRVKKNCSKELLEQYENYYQL
jgi:hypothetical protein